VVARGAYFPRKNIDPNMRLVIWMLRLYPPSWRERYEAEVVALLEQHDITLWTVLDLLYGALDARLEPHYRLSRQLISEQRLWNSWSVHRRLDLDGCRLETDSTGRPHRPDLAKRVGPATCPHNASHHTRTLCTRARHARAESSARLSPEVGATTGRFFIMTLRKGLRTCRGGHGGCRGRGPLWSPASCSCGRRKRPPPHLLHARPSNNLPP
jgi:hypothetical protein